MVKNLPFGLKTQIRVVLIQKTNSINLVVKTQWVREMATPATLLKASLKSRRIQTTEPHRNLALVIR